MLSDPPVVHTDKRVRERSTEDGRGCSIGVRLGQWKCAKRARHCGACAKACVRGVLARRSAGGVNQLRDAVSVLLRRQRMSEAYDAEGVLRQFFGFCLQIDACKAARKCLIAAALVRESKRCAGVVQIVQLLEILSHVRRRLLMVCSRLQ